MTNRKTFFKLLIEDCNYLKTLFTKCENFNSYDSGDNDNGYSDNCDNDNCYSDNCDSDNENEIFILNQVKNIYLVRKFY